ncbi:MAG: signal recognition particle-docking protein FtsY [Gammaproteobacteria bacterium]|nr:signal recognition particle-docking protein FtsY [Gammaproteobacteria bacterium]MDH3411117.1 signal recognition particle-docking protein FtsY [Gammaproteobacteria bacterium]
MFGKQKPADAESDASNERAPGLMTRLGNALGRTRGRLLKGFSRLLADGAKIDDALLEDVEELLLAADVGVPVTTRIVEGIRTSAKNPGGEAGEALLSSVRTNMLAVLEPVAAPLELPEKLARPFVVLVVGVNGTGKTTSIGKLAYQLKSEGRSVMLAAGDTFRAAAIEQLKRWGERNEIPVIAQHTGADSASVVYDALESATARGVDVLIADTAGRLHTQSNLMEELKKVRRVINKLDPEAPHEVLLVLDAGTGQNALTQAVQFNQAIGITGLCITKLDGTAKGGVVFAIAERLGVPIRYIGVGENLDDLRKFDAHTFVQVLLAR